MRAPKPMPRIQCVIARLAGEVWFWSGDVDKYWMFDGQQAHWYDKDGRLSSASSLTVADMTGFEVRNRKVVWHLV